MFYLGGKFIHEFEKEAVSLLWGFAIMIPSSLSSMGESPCSWWRVRITIFSFVRSGGPRADSWTTGILGEGCKTCVPELGVDVATFGMDGVDNGFLPGDLFWDGLGEEYRDASYAVSF